jgi:signal transduction histidine kinase
MGDQVMKAHSGYSASRQREGISSTSVPNTESATDGYEYEETRDLVDLVKDATELVRTKGQLAFADFRVSGSRWRQGESYIFVLGQLGNILVHPDPEMESRNELDLLDINGKPIIRGLIAAATTSISKGEGWYHYQWPVPNGLLPRWKSTYVRLVTTPSNDSYIVGSGIYNDRMERSFVVDDVKNAVAFIERNGEAAFRFFHDRTSPFLVKDSYIFVIGTDGVDLVNPAFPNLEGRNVLDLTDTQGRHLIREMFKVVETSSGSGWVDYLWPKPGESVSTQKSAYVSKAKLGDTWVLVGCGVYLADAPKAISTTKKLTAKELITLVREAAEVFATYGEKAFTEFRTKGSRWFRDDTYFFVWTLDGIRIFYAADAASEGVDVGDLKDVLGRQIGKMFLEAVSSPTGEGWAHYMYPQPGNIFPAWKSTFVKRVCFPSGKHHLIGCGIYNMEMDKAFIEDVVNRAAALIASDGKDAFSQLRDKTGPYVFMDTYVFVTSTDGIQLVNPAFPSLEGKSLVDLRDVNGKAVVHDEIAAAMKDGSAWLDCYWYKPGQNTPARKQTYVRKIQSGHDTYVIGSGVYMD